MPYYGRERVWESYEGKFLVKEELSGYKVIRVYTYAASRKNLPARLFSWGLFNIISLLIGLKIGHHDVLFIPNPFFLAGLPLHTMSRLKSMPVIYSVEDIYPDVAVRLGLLNSRWMISLVAMLEQSCYRRARYIRVLSEGMRQDLMARGVPPEKVITIPNFADTDFVRPLPRVNSFRERYGLADKFVILYAGNIGFSHGLDTVLRAAELLKNEPDMVFVLVGEGAAKAALQEMARELDLLNIFFIPFQPREDVPFVLASADVSLIPLRRDFVGESVPSKTYWVLASGRPVIAAVGQDTEVANLIEQAQCGIRVDPESPDALAGAILRLRGDASQRAVMGQRAREFVVEHYSREVVVNKFHMLIQSLL